MAASPKTPGKKHRHCPVLDRILTPAECGSQRGSKLDCPATCPHFPFGLAAPELWLRVESEWSVKALGFLQSKLGLETLQAMVKQAFVPAPDATSQLNGALHQIVMTELFLRPTASGQTLGEVWSDSAASGLNNDERVMTRHRRHARVTVLEVERVLDEHTFECRDLFEPERPAFVLCSNLVSQRVVRFSRILGWVTHFPGAARLSLPAFQVEYHVWRSWDEQLRTDFAAEAAPGTSIKDFLSFNFGRYAVLLHTVADAQMKGLLSQMDLHRCMASFRLKVPASEVEAVLRGKPEFQEDPIPPGQGGEPQEVRFNWLRVGESAALDKALEGLVMMDATVGGVGTAGRVRLNPEGLVLESMSKTKYEFTRRKLAEYLGDRIEFVGESIEDLARKVDDQRRQEATVDAAQRVFFDPAGSGEGAPPEPSEGEEGSQLASEERKREAQSAHERMYAGFLDRPLESLAGKTPRDAARDPELRPRLLEVMKSHVQGVEQRNRADGLALNLDGILDTLGLVELK